ncbi:MAG: UDP-4-amino-4,6-dideoxy-N-acetyl-beta-L-altrosamine transaminase [Myxococcales bacterium]
MSGAGKRLPYATQDIDASDLLAVETQLRDDWLTQGPRVAEFEEKLAKFVGARFAVAVANGTAALHLACLAAGLRAGDVALVPDITFVATANAVRYVGATPALIDVESDTGLMNLEHVESRFKAATSSSPIKAVLPVHFAGSAPDMARLRRLASAAGACVIEDAAHGLGTTYEVDGKTYQAASCAHADMGILSFHPVKHITTGEGGAITTNDPSLYQELLELRSHGITRDPARMRGSDGPWYYEQRSLGYNYRITDLQCALGISQLARLPRFLEQRRRIAARYDALFAAPEFGGLCTPLRVPTGVQSAYHLYVLRVLPRAGEGLEGVAGRRRVLFEKLRETNIFPQVHYVPVHRQPSFRDAGLSSGSFEGADAYYAGCISLPMFPRMDVSDADRVAASVLEILKA